MSKLKHFFLIFIIIALLPVVHSLPQKVYVWGLEGCGACKATEDFLGKEGVPYVFIDVSKAESTFSQLIKVLGYRDAVPVVVFVYADGSVSTTQGFSETTLKEALKAMTGGKDYSEGKQIPVSVQKQVLSLCKEASGNEHTVRKLSLYAIMFGREGCNDCDKMFEVVPRIAPLEAFTIDDEETKKIFMKICDALHLEYKIPLTIFFNKTAVYVVQGYADLAAIQELVKGPPAVLVDGRKRSLSQSEVNAVLEIIYGKPEEEVKSRTIIVSPVLSIFSYISAVFFSVFFAVAGLSAELSDRKDFALYVSTALLLLASTLTRWGYFASLVLGLLCILKKKKIAQTIGRGAALAASGAAACSTNHMLLPVLVGVVVSVALLRLKWCSYRLQKYAELIYSYSHGFGLAGYILLTGTVVI